MKLELTIVDLNTKFTKAAEKQLRASPSVVAITGVRRSSIVLVMIKGKNAKALQQVVDRLFELRIGRTQRKRVAEVERSSKPLDYYPRRRSPAKTEKAG